MYIILTLNIYIIKRLCVWHLRKISLARKTISSVYMKISMMAQGYLQL